MEPHKKGELTEAIVIAEMIRREIPVSKPFGDNERYDILIEDTDGRVLKVQIKTGWLNDGLISFRANSQHTNSQGNVYKPYTGDVDLFLIYSHDLNEIYLIEESEFDSAINLRVAEPRQYHRDMNWAADYEFDRRWPLDESPIRAYETTDPVITNVIEALEETGSTVCVPRDDDLTQFIVAVDETGYRIVRPTHGRISGGRVRFDAKLKDRVDCYLVYLRETDTLYAINADGFNSTITLRLDSPKQRHPNTKYAEDFEFHRNWPPTRLVDPLGGIHTRVTADALKQQGTSLAIEEPDEDASIIATTLNGQTHRIKPERGWRTDEAIRFQPTDGDYDWYTVYDPADEELYLLEAENISPTVELQFEQPKKINWMVRFADDHRFDDNWPPDPE